MTFKLTFNAPAMRELFDMDTHKGIRIKVENGTMLFQPVKKLTNDSVALDKRGREGGFVMIEGAREGDIKQLFDVNNPYFLLKTDENGWTHAVQHIAPEAPSRFVSHVRLWDKTPREKPKAAPKQKIVLTADDVNDRIREAFAMLNSPRKPGRPSLEYREAERIKENFETLATEFLGYRPGIDMQAIANSLGDVLDKVNVRVEH